MKKKSFSRLTAAQKRVAIARDVLDRITKRTLKPSTGFVLEGEGVRLNQKSVLAPTFKCEACALGAIFVSKVALGNEYDGPSPWDTQIVDKLVPLFSREQLAEIETAFEGRVRPRHIGLVDDSVAELYKNKRPIERARNIFTNVVANKGEFKP